MLWKKNKIDFLVGEGTLAGRRQGQGRRRDPRREGDRARDRLGRDADPWHRVLRPRHRHLGRLVASRRCRRRSSSSAPAPRAAEIASAYARIGVEVTLVEMLDQVLPAEDKDMARVVERQFKKDGIDAHDRDQGRGRDEQKTGVKVKAGDTEVKADYLVIAGGRAPDIEALGLDAAGVEDSRRTAASRSTSTSGLRRRASTRSATSSAARRSRTRPRRRAWSPSSTPPGADTHPVDIEPGRRRHLLPPAGRERRHDRGPGKGGRARRSRSASSSSAAPAPRSSTTTARAWSRSSATPSTARSSAPTSSATSPAT